MDEPSQQAIYIGVNALIFVVALSISITLMVGVKNVSEKALEYEASIPTGSRIVEIEDVEHKYITGDELLSYYARYMSEQSYLTGSNKFHITIVDKNENEKIKSYVEGATSIEDIKKYFKDNGVNISDKYELIVKEYNSNTQEVTIVLKEV